MEVKVWVKGKSRTELVEDFIYNQSFSYSVIYNGLVEVNKNEIIIHTDDDNLARLNPNFKLKKKCDQTIKWKTKVKEALVIHSSYKNIYYHWIYDILPQLKTLETNSNLNIIMSPVEYSFQIESLKLFCDTNNVFSESSFYEVDKLYLPSQTTRFLMPFNFVFEFLNNKLSYIKKNKTRNKIYIRRSNKYKRSILNEEKLIYILLSKGYLIYNLEDISFSKQVEIFSSANLIVSAHGSGLTNIVFCEPETSILEIYGPGCGERCFARISNYLNLNYSALEISKKSYRSPFHHLFYMLFPSLNRFDFKINIEEFNLNFKNYLA